jgi:hypothetical protein
LGQATVLETAGWSAHDLPAACRQTCCCLGHCHVKIQVKGVEAGVVAGVLLREAARLERRWRQRRSRFSRSSIPIRHPLSRPQARHVVRQTHQVRVDGDGGGQGGLEWGDPPGRRMRFRQGGRPSAGTRCRRVRVREDPAADEDRLVTLVRHVIDGEGSHDGDFGCELGTRTGAEAWGSKSQLKNVKEKTRLSAHRS